MLEVFFKISQTYIKRAIPIPMSNKDAISKVCNVFVFPLFESQIPNIISVLLINIVLSYCGQ